jgi:hypothetical protein
MKQNTFAQQDPPRRYVNERECTETAQSFSKGEVREKVGGQLKKSNKVDLVHP